MEALKTSIDAILRHRLSTDALPNHSSCPEGEDSWCRYNADPSSYKHKTPLPKAVALAIKPTFDRLKDNKLLERCLAGYNQNAGESFDSVLWKLCPKSVFVGDLAMKLCSSLAVILYYNGCLKLSDVFGNLGLDTGTYCLNELQ